jgi:imidazolonepropionase-like amidohydrolase
MPGMVSGHFHSTYHNIVVPIMPPLGLESPPAMQAYIAAHNARLALRSGVTSVVGANEAWDVDPSLAAAIEQGLTVGPRVIPGSREMVTTSDSNDVVPWWWESQAWGGIRICDSADEFRKAVRQEIKRGAEIVKLFATGGHGVRLSGDTSAITLEEMKAAVEAAHRLGKRARAHVASKAGIMMCVEAGIDIIDHGDGLDAECIAALAEKQMILVPSVYAPLQSLAESGDADPISGFQTDRGKAIRAMLDVLPAAVEGGVKICLGDDYGAKATPHGTYGKEPGAYVKWAGIDPLEVIKWATSNGGALVGRDDVGRLETGMVADVIVVRGDPIQDIDLLGDVDNVLLVMRDGQTFFDQLT